MKFRSTFSTVGVQWLERFVPVFEKLGNELTMLLTRNTIHLVQDAVSTGGLELHADLLKNEVFEEYKISSNNEDKIAFSLEPAVLHRVLKGLIGSEATSVDVKLIKRVISPGNAAPFLNFTSKGLVDITQDVPLAGPLTKREVCVLGTRWGFPKSRHLRLRTLPDCLSTPR
jgi:HUS1 checkpoint protein